MSDLGAAIGGAFQSLLWAVVVLLATVIVLATILLAGCGGAGSVPDEQAPSPEVDGRPSPPEPIVAATLERARFYCPGITYDAGVSDEARRALREAVESTDIAFHDHWGIDDRVRAMLVDPDTTADERMEAMREVTARRGRIKELMFNLDEMPDAAGWRTGVTTWDAADCPERVWGAVVEAVNVLWPEYGSQVHIAIGSAGGRE